MNKPHASQVHSDSLADFARIFDSGPPKPTPRLAIKHDDVRNGLGKLVLTLVELIRQLLEKQAIRRMEGNTLSDIEVERLGLTFKQLAEQVVELKKGFGLENDDLNIDLGPLGKLL